MLLLCLKQTGYMGFSLSSEAQLILPLLNTQALRLQYRIAPDVSAPIHRVALAGFFIGKGGSYVLQNNRDPPDYRSGL